MRVRLLAGVQITDGDDNKDNIFSLDDDLAVELLDGFLEAIGGREDLLLADGAFTIPLSSMASVKGFFLRATGDFNLAINGGAAINVRKGYASADTAATKGDYARVLAEMEVTSLQVTPVADCKLTWAVWGKPVT